MISFRRIKRIKVKTAAGILLAVGAGAIMFHVLVIAGVVPYVYVWGGRLQGTAEMVVFEAVSIVLVLVVMALVAMRGGFIKSRLPRKALSLLLWALAILFTFNTLANMLATTMLEMAIGTPLTLIAAVLCARLALRD